MKQSDLDNELRKVDAMIISVGTLGAQLSRIESRLGLLEAQKVVRRAEPDEDNDSVIGR